MDNKQLGGFLIFVFFVILVLNVVKPAGSFAEWLKGFGFSMINTGQPSTLNNDNSGILNEFSYQYQLVDISSSAQTPYSQIYYNAKLIRVYGNGRTENIIENFRNRFSGILSEPNQKLTQYYFPPNSDVLYFRFENAYLKGVDSRYHIYRYNVASDEMKDLYSNKYISEYAVPSPYDPRFMLAVDDKYRRLYVVSLEADNIRELVSLGANELMSSTEDAQGKPSVADIVWLSPNQAGYGIYRHETNSSGSRILRFIERRSISI